MKNENVYILAVLEAAQTQEKGDSHEEIDRDCRCLDIDDR